MAESGCLVPTSVPSHCPTCSSLVDVSPWLVWTPFPVTHPSCTQSAHGYWAPAMCLYARKVQASSPRSQVLPTTGQSDLHDPPHKEKCLFPLPFLFSILSTSCVYIWAVSVAYFRDEGIALRGMAPGSASHHVSSWSQLHFNYHFPSFFSLSYSSSLFPSLFPPFFSFYSPLNQYWLNSDAQKAVYRTEDTFANHKLPTI